jgi:hypothetical protein
MWFNLTWFAPEFQRGEVTPPDKTTASVPRFLEKGAGFGEGDIAEMVAEQFKIMRNVVAIHRKPAKRRADRSLYDTICDAPTSWPVWNRHLNWRYSIVPHAVTWSFLDQKNGWKETHERPQSKRWWRDLMLLHGHIGTVR